MKITDLFVIKEKEHTVERKKANRAIAYVTYAFAILFAFLIVYLLWYTYFRGPEDINNSYNPRQDIYAKRVIRGEILSRNGDVLAYTDTDENGNEKRVYPYGPLFAHAVGFSTHGKTGVELNTNIRLLTSNRPVLERVSNALSGNKSIGDNVVTTLDPYIQKAAYDALSTYKGAIIATDIKTGEILCLVSKPDFDPNSIATDWDRINDDKESSALLNRVTQGLYPPGSTFKIVTAM
nr:penicillin-binding protein 2 [Lachnospiraceae bacterium]